MRNVHPDVALDCRLVRDQSGHGQLERAILVEKRLSAALDAIEEIQVVKGSLAVSQNVYLRLLGDMDEDGTVEFEDYVVVRTYIRGVITLNDDELKIANFDRDGTVDAFDLFCIDKFINCKCKQEKE